jgi:hypothetical protein
MMVFPAHGRTVIATTVKDAAACWRRGWLPAARYGRTVVYARPRNLDGATTPEGNT